MENEKLARMDPERAKELFEYEMTEIGSKLGGEFGSVDPDAMNCPDAITKGIASPEVEFVPAEPEIAAAPEIKVPEKAKEQVIEEVEFEPENPLAGFTVPELSFICPAVSIGEIRSVSIPVPPKPVPVSLAVELPVPAAAPALPALPAVSYSAPEVQLVTDSVIIAPEPPQTASVIADILESIGA